MAAKILTCSLALAMDAEREYKKDHWETRKERREREERYHYPQCAEITSQAPTRHTITMTSSSMAR